MGGGSRAPLAALLGLAALAGAAIAQDVTVWGCDERNPGEVGVRELAGSIGDTVGVAVTVHTTAPLDAFALDLAFPTTLLNYVRTERGNLLHPGWTFSGNYIAAEGVIRIGGFDPAPVPADSAGQLAFVFFAVAQAGADTFSTANYIDDLSGYVACDSLNSPSHVDAGTWSRIKALYRD